MLNFSTSYKNVLKQRLIPHGYSMRKDTFYKDINNDVFLFFHVRKKEHSAVYAIDKSDIGFFPYCLDSEEIEDIVEEGGLDLTKILQKLAPDKMSSEYYKVLTNISNDEDILYSLKLLGDAIENIILPYLHRLSDLEFLYSEYLNISNGRITAFSYGLSLKLHKYVDALVYVDSQLLRHDDLIKKLIITQSELRNGIIINKDIWQSGVSNDVIKAVEKKILKKKTKEEYIELQIKICEKMIAESDTEISRLHNIKEALLTNNYSYLDTLVEETEAKSRAYVRQVLFT